MPNPEKSLQDITSKLYPVVTDGSRYEQLTTLVVLQDLFQVLNAKWYNIQITKKGVLLRLTLNNSSYHRVDGKTLPIAFAKLKVRLKEFGIRC